MTSDHGASSRPGPELLDTAGVAEQFGLSVSRISELYRDRATTGFPRAQSEDGLRQWDRGELDQWFANRKPVISLGDQDPEELLNSSQVAKLLGVKSIHAYLAKPGYFPEPEVTEATAGGYLRRYWRRGTVVTWDSKRPGKGNTRPKTKPVAPSAAPGTSDGPNDLVESREAAAMLGYASVTSFASAFSQGNLPELTPQGTSPSSAPGRASRQWPRAQVSALAQRRRADGEQLRMRQDVCQAALAQGAPVSARDLAERCPEGGTQQQWKASLDAERRRLKRG